jgi:AcrR family transcriptional regulator
MPQTNPTKARKTPLQARSKLMVETILDATARILVEEGFSRTTTNRVAERAGISVGSLYQYFPSREALVAGVAQRYSETMKATLETLQAQTQAEDLESALRILLDGISKAHAANPALSHVLAAELPRLGDMQWRDDIASRGISIAEQVLTSHKSQLRKGLDVKNAAFVVAKASEAIMDGIAQNGFRGAKATAVEQSLLDMVVRFVKEPLGQ